MRDNFPLPSKSCYRETGKAEQCGQRRRRRELKGRKMADNGASIVAAKRYRKTSAKGATYFTGRMGGVRVTLLKSR